MVGAEGRQALQDGLDAGPGREGDVGVAALRRQARRGRPAGHPAARGRNVGERRGVLRGGWRRRSDLKLCVLCWACAECSPEVGAAMMGGGNKIKIYKV